MLADRVRIGSGTKREVEVTIHLISGFKSARIYVGDGTVDGPGNPDYMSADTLVYTANGNETITLIVEEGSYIAVVSDSIYNFETTYYYTSLDSRHISMYSVPYYGNIHITEPMEIFIDVIEGS